MKIDVIEAIAAAILASVQSTGGASIGALGDKPVAGYMVSLDGHEEVTRDVSLSAIAAYVARHWDVVASDAALYFGAWQDGGTLYLDVSENCANRASAFARGVERHQRAVYDLNTGRSVPIPTYA